MMKSIVVAVVAVSCAHPASPPRPPEPLAHEALPDVPFDKLDPDQKAQFMKERVVPTMAPLFKDHDAKKFGDVGCATCHGAGAKDGHFDMPNPKLPKLVMAQLASGTAKFDKRDIEWMATTIKPAMAKLLGRAEWTPENTSGFGCSACHTVEW